MADAPKRRGVHPTATTPSSTEMAAAPSHGTPPKKRRQPTPEVVTDTPSDAVAPPTHPSESSESTDLSAKQAASNSTRATSTNANASPATAIDRVIKDLGPATAPNWLLRARVVARGPVRKWENLRGEGTLQEVFLTDRAGDFIRGTLFNAAVNKFAAVTTPGSACVFSGGKIKFAFSGSNPSIRESNLTFSDSADIQPLGTEELASVPPNIIITKLSQLAQHPAKTSVNVIGILVQAASTKRIMTAQGKQLQKRELILTDDSNTRLVCTLWGNNARDELDEVLGRPILIKGGQINDYMGTRAVTAGIGASFMMDPVLARATELSAWYECGVDHASFPLVSSP